jgi:hypothetical protein
MTISMWTLALTSVALLTAQGSNDKTLRGTVTIKSEGGSVAIHGKAAPPAGDFLFCVDQDRATAQRIDFTGPARVLYRAAPIAGIPAGVTISGPESVANTLAVIADDGKAWIFVAKGQQPLPGAADRAKATTVNVTVVRRLDWTTGSGPRRGLDIAGCLAPAG